jgi:hypothetical protein
MEEQSVQLGGVQEEKDGRRLPALRAATPEAAKMLF